MLPQAVIAALSTNRLTRYAAIRALVAHRPWIVPASGDEIALTDHTLRLFSTTEAHKTANAREPLGVVATLDDLDDAIVDLPATVTALVIDDGSPFAMDISGDELVAFRRTVEGLRLERAMSEGDLERVFHGAYFVPYTGEMRKNHQLVYVPVGERQLVAAFTTEDGIEAFLAAEPPRDMKLAEVTGADLFTKAAPLFSQGVAINIAGPKAYAFDLETCQSLLQFALPA